MSERPGPTIPTLPPIPDTAPTLRACLIALGGSRFAVDVRSAREVAVFEEMTRVPRAPRHLVGVANLRGTVMPIVDARGLLGCLPEVRPARSVRTLVLRDGAMQAAVVVDAVLGLEPFDEVIPDGSPGAARARGPRPFVASWLSWAGETVPLLDVPRLLAALRVCTGEPVAAHGEPA
ncbi:MAG TPA: chemotaxis protein CheW [Methylomirabilota bacterium]|nr:chemotaxis protein CheW [Methylomirabilota bacterium]